MNFSPGQVEPDRDNLRHDRSLLWIVADPPWHIDALNHPTVVYRSEFVEVDASELRDELGREVVNLALRLNGIGPLPAGHSKTVWTDSATEEGALKVCLPCNLFDSWNRL